MTETTPPTLLDAMADPDLFGPHFRPHKTKGDTWARWRCFLRALFALPPEPGDLDIYTACTGRTDWPTEPAPEVAIIAGRRGGKSRILALVAVYLCCFFDYSEHLAPGEIGCVSIIAADRKQGRAIFRFALGLLKNTPLIAPMIADDNSEAIILNNNTTIEISTASFRTVRGQTLIACLADECAFWRTDENSSNPDVEILRAVRPALGTIPGAMLLIASSPYAKRGELYRAYRQYFGKTAADVLIWKAATSVMNPSFPQRILDREYEKDPESAKAEFGAEFRDDLADFVSRETIDAVTCPGRYELPPAAGISYSAFLDVSAGAQDSFACAIAHQEDDKGVLDLLIEIRPPFHPDVAVAETAAALKRYGISRVVGDKFSGVWPVARFAEHGITFEQSARPKSDIYHDVLPLLTGGRVELLDIPRLAAQFCVLERRTARSGKDSIAEPPGLHDDCCNVVAGVLTALDLDRRPPLVSSNQMLADGVPVALPKVCDLIVAVLAADQTGQCAVAYWLRSRNFGYRLVLADYETGPLSSALFVGIKARVLELRQSCRAREGARLFCTLEPLARAAAGCGLPADIVPPPLITDPARLALAAAAHVVDGAVKIGEPAWTRAESSPLRGQLDLRGGDAVDASPLRLALLAGIAITLDDASQARAAA